MVILKSRSEHKDLGSDVNLTAAVSNRCYQSILGNRLNTAVGQANIAAQVM
jgi:hypothetical protein